MTEKKQWITRKKVTLSLAISLLVMLANYVASNTSIPLPDEIKVLQWWDILKKWNNIDTDSIPEEVLLVDVAYDKQLVDYAVKVDNAPIHVGQYAITDRQKLLDFLTIAHHADNYKYIMLDVIFEEGIVSPCDSALFQMIISMPRIVIPEHEGMPLQDSILYRKAANADYTVTWEDTDFARFQYIHHGVKSMPLSMYEDLSGHSISKLGFLYFSRHWICRNGITLKMPIKITKMTKNEGDKPECNVSYLGSDLLAIDSIWPINERIKDKIVVIGNFKDDIHDTYVGPQPGSIICLNAYYALERGDHIILGKCCGVFIFYLIIAILYFVVSIAYLNGFSLSAMTKNPWLKLLFSLVSVNVLFWTIAIIAYILPLDTVYNVWIPIGTFTLLDFFCNIYSSYKEQRNEKNENHTVAPAACDVSGGTNESAHIQSALHESSPDTD